VRIRRFDGPTLAPTLVWEDRVAYVRPAEPFRAGASAGDLDGERGDELALSIFPEMYVFRRSVDGSMRPLWARYGAVNNQPIVEDFDRDGIEELGVGDGARISFYEIDRQLRGPDVPGGLEAWSLGIDSVHVEWSPVDGADAYHVYRATVVSDTGALRFSLVGETPATSFDDSGATMPAGGFRAGDRIVYAVAAIDGERSPQEGDVAISPSVVVHDLARPVSAAAASDSSIALELSEPVREALYRTGAFDVRDASNGTEVRVSSVTFAGERTVLLHVDESVDGDSLVVRLTWMFRDAMGSPGDTLTLVGVRMPVSETPGERFIATRAELVDRSSGSGARVRIRFNEAVDPATGANPRNYTILPATEAREQETAADAIVAAAIDPEDPSSVILTLSPDYPIGPLGRNYTITVRGVRSTAGVEINDGTESVVGLTLEGEMFDAVMVYPQPFSIVRDGEATFAGLPRDAIVEIMTQAGATVRTLRETEHNGGVRWDGRDGNGRPVPSGIYLYQVSVGAGATAQRSPLRKLAVIASK
jgi:hypothetical protein